MHLDTAAACALIGLVAGWFVPALIAQLPEPAPEPEDTAGKFPDKVPYPELAASPGLAWKSALASAVAAGLLGLELGWVWDLTWLVYLCPVGVALAYVDFRTWYLPTRLLAPSYGVVIVLILVGFALHHDTADLVRAALGWAIAGLVYLALWFFTPGMAYGDVRLSGVLGLLLGHLGWGQLTVGIWLGFTLGGLSWFVLRALRFTTSRSYPAGPFMLLGALVGVLWGGDVWTYLVEHRS